MGKSQTQANTVGRGLKFSCNDRMVAVIGCSLYGTNNKNIDQSNTMLLCRRTPHFIRSLHSDLQRFTIIELTRLQLH